MMVQMESAVELRCGGVHGNIGVLARLNNAIRNGLVFQE
jgi:hypothetical protein